MTDAWPAFVPATAENPGHGRGTNDEMTLPSLIVIAGRPGAGKTTLAHALARAVRCPAICRDEIKEGLVHTDSQAGEPRDDVGRHVYEAFFEALHTLLRRRISLVAEAAFQHRLWAPALDPLREVARVRLIVCTIDATLARARRVERHAADPDRERFHPDAATRSAAAGRDVPASPYDPPRLDVPTLTVDTSAGYRPTFDAIVAFARG